MLPMSTQVLAAALEDDTTGQEPGSFQSSIIHGLSADSELIAYGSVSRSSLLV